MVTMGTTVILDVPQGLPGPPGKSAYEIAVEEGFVGTQSEWLQSLVGEGVLHYAVGVRATPSRLGEDDDFISGETFVYFPVTALDPAIEPSALWIQGTSNDRDGIYVEVGDAGGGLATYEFVANPGVGATVWVTADLVDDTVIDNEGPVGYRLWQIDAVGLRRVLPTDLPGALKNLSGFTRPMVSCSRCHIGGEPAWPGGSPIDNLVDPDTGQVLAPLYDDAFVLANGSLTHLTIDGDIEGDPIPVDDPPRPIIDGIPYYGGPVIAMDQADPNANGLWTISHDGDEWVAERVLAVGLLANELIVAGTPFEVLDGNLHGHSIGHWGFDGLQPSDPGHRWNFYRPKADLTYFDPGDSGLESLSAGAALREIAERLPVIISQADWAALDPPDPETLYVIV